MLPVLSGSMAPLLAPGMEIVIRGARWRDCRAGDIIVFRRGDDLTAHRLLLVVPLPGVTLLYEKGDANQRGRWIRGRKVAGIVARARGAAAAPVDFDAPSARQAARIAARRQLGADLRERVPARLRRLLKRLRRNS